MRSAPWDHLGHIDHVQEAAQQTPIAGCCSANGPGEASPQTGPRCLAAGGWAGSGCS